MSEREDRVEPATETLRVTRVESRLVLDHRIDLLDEIDDKALRTVRASIVVLALVVSTAQIAGPDRIRSIPPLSAVSVGIAGCLFVFAIVVGTGIYAVSRVPYGIGPSHRSEAITGRYSGREWLVLLLEEYEEWTAELRFLSENNARWLLYVQGSFVAGVLLVVVSLIASIAVDLLWEGPLLISAPAIGLMVADQKVRVKNR